MGKVASLLPCSLFKSPPKPCHFLPVVDQLLDDDGLDHLDDDDDDDDGDDDGLDHLLPHLVQLGEVAALILDQVLQLL